MALGFAHLEIVSPDKVTDYVAIIYVIIYVLLELWPCV